MQLLKTVEKETEFSENLVFEYKRIFRFVVNLKSEENAMFGYKKVKLVFIEEQEKELGFRVLI